MKIIGHRGAAGLALENSLASIRAAKKADVDVIEFDVHLTSDQQFILSHDSNLRRISDFTLEINEQTLAMFDEVVLHNGEKTATLLQALKTAGATPVFIEPKGSGWVEQLVEIVQEHKQSNITVITQDSEDLAAFHELLPDIPTYLVQRFNPIDIILAIQIAKANKFTGVDINFWLLNPLTYWLAKRDGLDVVVYTVNHLWIARFLTKLFPDISITTDHPDKLRVLRNKRHK